MGLFLIFNFFNFFFQFFFFFCRQSVSPIAPTLIQEEVDLCHMLSDHAQDKISSFVIFIFFFINLYLYYLCIFIICYLTMHKIKFRRLLFLCFIIFKYLFIIYYYLLLFIIAPTLMQEEVDLCHMLSDHAQDKISSFVIFILFFL